MAYAKRSYGARYNRAAYSKPSGVSGPKPRVTNPSEYQIAIFQAVKEAGEQVLLNFRRGISKVIGIHVDALAGCGKTTSSVEKDYFLPEEIREDSCSLAFNSPIAKVLKERVADGVEAKTIHALGRAAGALLSPS